MNYIDPILAIDLVTGPYEHVFWKVLIAPLALVVLVSLWLVSKKRYNWVDVSLPFIIMTGLAFGVTLFGVNTWAGYQPDEKGLAALKAKKDAEAKKTAGTEKAAKEKTAAEAETARKKSEYDAALSEFKDRDGKEINSAIIEMTALRDELERRIKNMGETLEEAGKDSSSDADMNKWKEDLSKVNTSLKELDASLVDAFIEYQKFKNATTSTERAALDEALKSGAANANEIKSRYKSLKQQISGDDNGS